jgi:hypothetical protein
MENNEQKSENPQPPKEPEQNSSRPEQKTEACCQKEKHCHCGCRGHRFNFGRFLLGLTIIVVGLAFLARTSGWVDLNFSLNWNYVWPILIIIGGLSLISFRGWLGGLIGSLITLIVIAFVFLMIFNVFGFGATITGSGQVIAEERAVADFNKIYLSGYGNLIIQQSTTTEALKIEAEDNLMPKIKTRVDGQTLKIDYEWQGWPWLSFKPKKPINFYVTVKNINQISVSGAGTVKSDSIKTGELKIEISGAGQANLSVETQKLSAEISGVGEFLMAGQADFQKIQLSGAAKYDGKKLASKEADAEISGAGQAILNVSEKLSAEISGMGKIEYIGNPQLTQKISGAGKIDKLNE